MRLPIFLRRFRREIGFTLTELVIAMLVLGVLASVAIPSFLGARNNSYDKEAQAFIKVRVIFLMHRLHSVVILRYWPLIYKNLNQMLMLFRVLFLRPVREW
jgi:prepilin-type N-terminal cleavage/methylation domain-containing protein